MERYYNNDDDQDEPFFNSDDNMDDSDDELTEIDEIEFIDKSSILDVMQMDLDQIGLNQELLDKAVAIAEKDLWWWFRSTAYKLEQIDMVYKRLLKITDGVDEPKKEE